MAGVRSSFFGSLMHKFCVGPHRPPTHTLSLRTFSLSLCLTSPTVAAICCLYLLPHFHLCPPKDASLSTVVGRPFDTINPQFVSPPPLTLHFTFPAFPLRVQHSVGPSCVEASLSASRRCHRNLVRHRRLWAPSTRICMLCLQRNREQELWGNLRVHEHRRHGKWQRLIWKIKSCFESDDAAARVSFCINNSF